MTVAPLNSAGAFLEGPETKKPTTRFASGGGLETFCCLLAVSPVARSACRARNIPRSRGRSDRRDGRYNAALLGNWQHAKKHSIGCRVSHAKVAFFQKRGAQSAFSAPNGNSCYAVHNLPKISSLSRPVALLPMISVWQCPNLKLQTTNSSTSIRIPLSAIQKYPTAPA